MKKSLLSVFVIGCLVGVSALTALAEDTRTSAERMYFSPSFGRYDFDGGQEVDDGIIGTFRLGYDWSDWFSFETAFNLTPYLKENTVGRSTISTNEQGVPYLDYQGQVSRADKAFGDTYAAGISGDILYHFTPWERLDPYFTAGVGGTWFGEKVNGANLDLDAHAGGGVMYHINDMWAFRADFKGFIAGGDTEPNSVIDAGLVWHWNANIAPKFVADGGTDDTDGDGLKDRDEPTYNCDIYNPDTDADGLKDGEEVYTYTTDPTNPDTDDDALKDGEEVKQYLTDPKDRDTDKGGVNDGHEVFEDSTDPTAGHGSDDLIKLTLYIQFEYDKAIIKPEYFAQLDIIGNKMLKRYPGTTVRIEGHADRKTLSTPEYNQDLSDKRAAAVMGYFNETWKIESSRMASKGFGFNRPTDLKKVNLKTGNPENRRVEVYIKGLDNTAADIIKARREFEEAAPDSAPLPTGPSGN